MVSILAGQPMEDISNMWLHSNSMSIPSIKQFSSITLAYVQLQQLLGD
jgi:hypothetical protein